MENQSKLIDVTFINHCEDECGLGTAQFDCVVCEKLVIDYDDLWYSQDDPVGVVVNTNCELCKTEPIVNYVKPIMN